MREGFEAVIERLTQYTCPVLHSPSLGEDIAALTAAYREAVADNAVLCVINGANPGKTLEQIDREQAELEALRRVARAARTWREHRSATNRWPACHVALVDALDALGEGR